MTKLSGIAKNGSPASNDYLVGVSNGNVDQISTLAQIAPVIGQLIQASQGAWVTPTLATGWSNFDAGNDANGLYGYPQYMKDALGFIHVRGLCTNSSGAAKNPNSTIFTFPLGFRPLNMIHRQSILISDKIGQINVRGDGTLEIVGTQGVAANEWVSLNNVTFRAEG